MARLLTERADALGQTRKNSAEERKLIDELDALYDEGKKARDRWVKDVDLERDLRLYRGEGGPADRDPYFEANFIQAFIDRMVAQLTDNRPIIRVENKKLGLKKVAQVVQPVVSAVWEDEKMQRQTFKMCHTAAVNASAGLYTGYDMVTDSFVMEVLSIKQVVFDPMVKEAALIGSGDYLFIDRVRALDDLRARFPARGAEVKADAVLSETRAQAKARTILSPLNDLLGRRSGQSEALPRAEVRECLINDRRRDGDGTPLFPGGRMILKTRDLILWDGPNPYWDGVPPIDWYDWIVDPEHPYGSSEPRRLMRLQLSFNQIMDGLVENQLLSNFLSVIGDHDAVDPKTWEKLQKIAGSIILRKRNRNAALTIQPPPVFGADKINLSRAIFTFAQLLTGVTDVTLGETPGSLQSGQAIEGLQEGANLMTRSRASRLEDFFVRVGNKLLSRIFQFFPCTDTETECLTKRGWLRYDQLHPADELYTLNPETEDGEWSPLLRLNVYDYDGEMYRIAGTKVDALVTPNHRWPVRNRALERRNRPRHHTWGCAARRLWGDSDRRIQFVETRELNGEMVIPARVPLSKAGLSVAHDDAFVELMGWVVTEGSYGRYGIDISQSQRVNPDKCALIRRCLRANGVTWRERTDRNGVVQFYFAGPVARRILLEFPGKRFTYEFIVALSRAQLELLYQAMMAGDGSRRTHFRGKPMRYSHFYSSDPVLADQFQMIACLAGYPSRQSVWPRSRPHLDCHDVRTSEGSRGGTTECREVLERTQRVHYAGKVWCPTTTTGTWVARRAGRVYVTGNSDRVVHLVGPSGDAIEYAVKRQEFFVDDDGKPIEPEKRREALRYVRFLVSPGSSAPGSRLKRAQLMMDLYKAALAPGVDVLRAADFPNPEEMVKRAREERATMPPEVSQALAKSAGEKR